MSVQSKLKRATNLIPVLHRFLTPSKYLMVISHMRSRSSLLAHILGSNDQIYGYFEMHRSYESPATLLRLKADLLGMHEKRRASFYLDKLVHNQYRIADEVLNQANMKPVFLVREPESTLQSMLKKGKDKEMKPCRNPEEACDYYCARLTELEKYAERMNGDYCFINSDALVEQSGPLLEALGKWLELDGTLSANYSIFGNTGQAPYGDNSNNIQAGKILKVTSQHEFTISEALLSKARAAYERHCVAMSKAGTCI